MRLGSLSGIVLLSSLVLKTDENCLFRIFVFVSLSDYVSPSESFRGDTPVDSQRLLLMKLQNLLGCLINLGRRGSRHNLYMLFYILLGGIFEFTVSCNVTFLFGSSSFVEASFLLPRHFFTVQLIQGWLSLDDDILAGTDSCSIVRMFDLKKSHISLIALSRLSFPLNCLTISDAWYSNLSLFAFFQIYIFILTGLFSLAEMSAPMYTIPWSPNHGSGSHLLTRDGLFARNRSSIFSCLVGNVTTCSR